MLLRHTLREVLIFTKHQLSERTIVLILVFISFFVDCENPVDDEVERHSMSYVCYNFFPI